MLKPTPGDHERPAQGCGYLCQAPLLLWAAAWPLEEKHRLELFSSLFQHFYCYTS